MRYHCMTCDGMGFLIPQADGSCPLCKGSGRSTTLPKGPCAICEGSGKMDKHVDCPHCAGQGWTD